MTSIPNRTEKKQNLERQKTSFLKEQVKNANF